MANAKRKRFLVEDGAIPMMRGSTEPWDTVYYCGRDKCPNANEILPPFFPCDDCREHLRRHCGDNGIPMPEAFTTKELLRLDWSMETQLYSFSGQKLRMFDWIEGVANGNCFFARNSSRGLGPVTYIEMKEYTDPQRAVLFRGVDGYVVFLIGKE